MTTQQDQEREAFEAWAQREYRNVDEYSRSDYALGLAAWQARAALAQQSQALSDMEVRKDAAYLERNQCVAGMAHLARMLGLKAGVAKTAIEGWSEDWHGCLYIDLPTGQVSWHFHDSQAHLFAGLQAYGGSWDGHDTPEKYRRVSALAQQAEPPELSPELAQKPLEQQAEPMRVPEGFALVPVEPTAGNNGREASR